MKRIPSLTERPGDPTRAHFLARATQPTDESLISDQIPLKYSGLEPKLPTDDTRCSFGTDSAISFGAARSGAHSKNRLRTKSC